MSILTGFYKFVFSSKVVVVYFDVTLLISNEHYWNNLFSLANHLFPPQIIHSLLV